MISLRPVLAVLALLAAAAPLAAQHRSELLFSNKQWQVEMVAWDDGILGCVASVVAGSEQFLMWTFEDQTVQLQFFSEAWEFGEGDTTDLEVQVDSMAPWNLTDAELYLNSVLFTLPDSDAGVEFIVEVAKGNRLFLRSKDGSDVQDYSLAGSRASIDTLIECGNVLTKGASGNPFN